MRSSSRPRRPGKVGAKPSLAGPVGTASLPAGLGRTDPSPVQETWQGPSQVLIHRPGTVRYTLGKGLARFEPSPRKESGKGQHVSQQSWGPRPPVVSLLCLARYSMPLEKARQGMSQPSMNRYGKGQHVPQQAWGQNASGPVSALPGMVQHGLGQSLGIVWL